MRFTSVTLYCCADIKGGFQGNSVVKNPPGNAGDVGLIPGSGRFPEGGNDSPLQYSGLENPMDRGAWWATVYGLEKTQNTPERLKNNHQFQGHFLSLVP